MKKTPFLRKSLLCVVALLFVWSLAVFAVIETGTLKIRVIDAEGVALPGATVSIKSPTMMGSKTLVSDAMGEVLFISLTPGIYESKTSLTSFQEVVSKEIKVSINKETSLSMTLKLSATAESITVTAEYAAVDTTKASVTEHVTVATVESLPVARDYVGYLQLAAGVNMVPNSQGTDLNQDPAGKGGLNYADRGLQRIGGKRGSRDNYYFIDGVEVTDMYSQTALMTFNNEAIQEQELITSGVPAEYGGGKGVIANVVTKSGGNSFIGSANIYGQSKSFFVGYGGKAYDEAPDSTKLEGYKDNKYDTAFTFGGPVLKDKFWFFVSAQYRNNASKFNLSQSASSAQEEVDYTNKRKGFFGKFTFKIDPKDSITFLTFLDKYDIAGSRDKNLIKVRETVDNRSMGVLSGYYQRLFGDNIILEFRYGHNWWDRNLGPRFPDAGKQNSLLYKAGTYPPIDQFNFGGPAGLIESGNKRDQFGGSFEWYKGDMRLKFGLAYADEKDREKPSYFMGGFLTSLNPSYAGKTFGQVFADGLINSSEYKVRILNALNTYKGPAFELVDLNHDGVVSQSELDAVPFTAMNEHGLNYMGRIDSKLGVNEVRAQRITGYFTDDWKVTDYLSINAGLRFENHHYKDSKGGTILNMKTKFLPRIGGIVDVPGKYKQKLSVFYGHYSDPISFSMIHFAGNISGRVMEEQVYLYDQWFTYRFRGSAEFLDCVWSPVTKDGLAKEFSVTHEIDLGKSLVLSSQGYYRQDRNIIEDYDPAVYIEGISPYTGDPTYGKNVVPWSAFGYPETGLPGAANYFLSNLIGAKRNIWGLDFDISKRFTQGHNLTFQYSYKAAKGNSQSDNNADLQGDFMELDPKNAWMFGPTPGTIPHKIKVFGSYKTKFGLDVGGLFYWNSGLKWTESTCFMPGSYNIYYNWPLNAEGTNFAITGANQTPSYYQIDLKFNYSLKVKERSNVQFFLDIYNLTNNQAKIDIQYAHDEGTFQYKDTTELLLPLRIFVGARFQF